MDRILGDKQLVTPPRKACTTSHTFAPEILSEIFLHCLPDSDGFPESVPRLSLAPLLLGRVCSRWRAVSNSFPALWSRFAVGGDELSHAEIERDLEVSKRWISNSGAHPLTISVHYTSRYRDDTLVPQILEIIVSQSWRWKEIKLAVFTDIKDMVFAPFQTGCLPQLVTFESTITGVKGYTELSVSSAPQLQSLRHHGYGVRFYFSGGIHDIKRIELHRLDHRCSAISLADLCNYFTQCPLLEDLSISVHIVESEVELRLPDELPSTIKLSHLTHLVLFFSRHIDPCCLFDRLFLPVLISLDVAMDIDSYNDWPHLRTMLTRSRPPLQTLRLVCVPMTQVAVVGCLSCVPALTSLDLDGMVCSDIILDALTMDEADVEAPKRLCPWLETVELGTKWGRDCNFSARSMTSMIVSRRKHALRTSFTEGIALKLVGCEFDFDRIRYDPDIAECVKDGLKLPFSLHRGEIY